MNVHKNARLTPKGREAMVRAVVDDGLTSTEVGRQLLGHSKIESTVRYLGIEVDDAIEIAEKIDI